MREMLLYVHFAKIISLNFIVMIFRFVIFYQRFFFDIIIL